MAVRPEGGSTDREWRDGVVEAVMLSDLKWLATATLAVPLLIGESVKKPNWKEWDQYCQNPTETRTKLSYFKHLDRTVDAELVCELIKAGILMQTNSKEAGKVIDRVVGSGVEVGPLSVGIVLVTIYSLGGADKFRQRVVELSKIGREELWGRLRKLVQPDKDTIERLKDLFASLVDYV